MKPDKNDPKLTAYALGELSEVERTAFEKKLQNNPEARKAAEEIQTLGSKLEKHYAAEAKTVLTDEQHETIRKAARKKIKTIHFPRYVWVPLATAAALAGILLFHMPSVVVTTDKTDAFTYSAPASPKKLRIRTETKLKEESRQDSVMGFTADREAAPAMSKCTASPSASWYIAPPPQEPRPSVQYGPSIEDYAEIRENPFQRVGDHPLSTFSIDVDTASYSNMRRFLKGGTLPPKDAVRIEELINYFDYHYEAPDGKMPFTTHLEVSSCPWNLKHRLVRIGLKGRVIEPASRPPMNLVFLLDVSGSMNNENKLPMVKRAMTMLAQQMDERDRVSIVVYAGASGLVLPPTSGADRQAIIDALKRLSAGGGTNGGQGIELAYRTASQNFSEKGVNRVILCTDGDFNIGITQGGDLNRLIEEKAEGGIFLSVLGFGTGNYKDSTMEQLADRGNGNYAYIDTFSEARKVLADQMSGTLITIAKDVKIQVEFNPEHVAGYRLIGYENRMLKTEDFNDDKKDAGEIGAGHTVTALYEVVPAGQPVGSHPPIDALKYQPVKKDSTPLLSGELLTVKLRWKEPDANTSTKAAFPLTDSSRSFKNASPDFQFAASVAGFGMLLRESEHKGTLTYAGVLEWALGAQGKDSFGYRREFIDLVRNAQAIKR